MLAAVDVQFRAGDVGAWIRTQKIDRLGGFFRRAGRRKGTLSTSFSEISWGAFNHAAPYNSAGSRGQDSSKGEAMKFAALFALLLLVAPAMAEQPQYPFELPAKHPAATAAWHKVVPPRFRREDWIFNFQGVASPISAIALSGKPYLLGAMCKPHDCGFNQVSFLIAVDGSRAAARTLFDGKPGPNFGAPTEAEMSLLRRKMDNPNSNPQPGR